MGNLKTMLKYKLQRFKIYYLVLQWRINQNKIIFGLFKEDKLEAYFIFPLKMVNIYVL